ncbi:HU family DNA-binding protein, partial [Pseudomonas savastanoi]
TGRNPSTGAAIEIAAKKVVKFVPAKVLNDAINHGASQKTENKTR